MSKDFNPRHVKKGIRQQSVEFLLSELNFWKGREASMTDRAKWTVAEVKKELDRRGVRYE